ncbi:hypothetical protein B0H11DRAFT_47263 [Mycena galericulata]|nr:hypothetical protein B0H11DRAFT_47263 [Mycena galericulata]
MEASAIARDPDCDITSADVGAAYPKRVDAPEVTVASQPGSRHHTLLHSNMPPELSEVPFIQSTIANTDAYLTRLRLGDAGIQQLEEEHASLSTYLAQNKAILSPLRRMPPEILAEIFVWTLPSFADASLRDVFNINDSPWVLTHISSHWRAVSISTPALWSLITINYDEERVYPLAAIQAQIHRAQSLKIHFYPSDNCLPDGPQMEMFALLAENALRWEELSMGVNRAMLPHLTVLRHRVPLLRRLWLEWNDEDPVLIDSVECFIDAPSLIVVGVYEEYPSVSIPMPTHQLTRYQLGGSMEMHLRILRLAINLVEACVEIPPNTEAALPQMVEHLSLRRLFVSDAAILDYIKAPALEEIALWASGNDSAHNSAHLLPFQDRSSCSLRRLCLRGKPNSDDINRISLKLPSIVELVMIHVGSPTDENVLMNTSMSTFTVFDLTGHIPLAPHLRHISFAYEGGGRVDYEQYVEMLQSRRKAPTCALQSAALLLGDPDGTGPDPEALSKLDNLRKGGLDLLLLTGSEASDFIDGLTYDTTFN